MAKSINTEAMFKAKQDLNNFLKEHPELQPLQVEIDQMLAKVGNDPDNRNSAIQAMMIAFVRKLNDQFQELKGTSMEGEKIALRCVKNDESEKI